jgi:hypothetical protein
MIDWISIESQLPESSYDENGYLINRYLIVFIYRSQCVDEYYSYCDFATYSNGDWDLENYGGLPSGDYVITHWVKLVYPIQYSL